MLKTLWAKRRWAFHDGVIADALTKRDGNSVTMWKTFGTGHLSIVDEDKELANRRQLWEDHGRNLRPHRQLAGRWTGSNDMQLDAHRRHSEIQTSKLTCQPCTVRVIFF